MVLLQNFFKYNLNFFLVKNFIKNFFYSKITVTTKLKSPNHLFFENDNKTYNFVCTVIETFLT